MGAPERSGRGERARLEETETELETEEGDETGGANETGGAPFRPRAVDAFVARRAKRCAMVQRFSRQTYMGRTSPTFFPRKMLRALRSVRKINQIYGYKVSP